MAVTFWPIRLVKMGSMNHLSTYKLFINLQVWRMYVQGNQVGGLIGCQVSTFPNSCIASSLLQEELLFCAWPKRQLQQIYDEDHAHFLYIRFWEPWRKGTSLWQFMVTFDYDPGAVDACTERCSSSILAILNSEANNNSALATVIP